jgi:hypothetical protein
MTYMRVTIEKRKCIYLCIRNRHYDNVIIIFFFFKKIFFVYVSIVIETTQMLSFEYFSHFIIKNRLRFPASQILLRTSSNKNIIALSKSKYSQNNHFSSDYNDKISSCKSRFIRQFSFLLRFIFSFLYCLKQYLCLIYLNICL